MELQQEFANMDQKNKVLHHDSETQINGCSSLSVCFLSSGCGWMFWDCGLTAVTLEKQTRQAKAETKDSKTKKQLLCVHAELLLPSVLGRCWLGIRKSIGPAKN